jgi:uncharacterized membrane protein
MQNNLIPIIIILGLPWLLIIGEKHIRVIRWIGPIVLCYLTGILIANTNVLDPDSGMLSGITEISICLAIPLLLFSTDLKRWMKHAKKTIISFFISVAGVVTASLLAYVVFRDNVPDAHKVSAMMIGVYTGGTPNMSAIGIAIGAREELFVLLNSADIVISGIYFIFLLTVAKPLLHLFLPAFSNSGNSGAEQTSTSPDEPTKKLILPVAIGLTLSVLVFGASIGISLLITGKMTASLIILLLTSLAIGLSFISKVRFLAGTYKTAEYLLFVFAIAMGSMADLGVLLSFGPHIFLYVGFVVLLSIILHFTLAAIFRIDADTVIITSTAAIYGPAFVGPVANAIKNPLVIVSGITMGLLGITFANYLGILVAYFLQ